VRHTQFAETANYLCSSVSICGKEKAVVGYWLLVVGFSCVFWAFLRQVVGYSLLVLGCSFPLGLAIMILQLGQKTDGLLV